MIVYVRSACAAILLFVAAPVLADPIVLVTGDVAIVAPPAEMSYADDINRSGAPRNAAAILFNEYQNHVMPMFSALDPIMVDYWPLQITTPGTFPADPEVGGQIASGVVFDSYILHFEPETLNESGSPFGTARGTIVFERPILGIQTIFELYRPKMDLFERANIRLSGGSGLERWCDPESDESHTCDRLMLSADRLTLSFVMNVNGATDDIRIFLVDEEQPPQVPEPASSALTAVGVVGVLLLRLRRAHTRGPSVRALPNSLKS